MSAPELWRPIDIANAYGVTRQRVNAWTKAAGFPAPEPGVAGRQWRASAVRAWVADRRPEVAAGTAAR